MKQTDALLVRIDIHPEHSRDARKTLAKVTRRIRDKKKVKDKHLGKLLKHAHYVRWTIQRENKDHKDHKDHK